MRLETVPPESEFEHVREKWMCAATKQFDPFCSLPAWQLAFHETFRPKRRLLVEYASGSMLCFAEEILSPSDIYLAPIESHWFFGSPLLGWDSHELLRKAMGFIAKEYAPSFPKILISGIASMGPLKKRLLNIFGKSFDIYLSAETLQCSASLAGGVDRFLSNRTANFRSKLKKACKRAVAKGISFERVLPTSPEEASTIYSRIFSVERASWKGINYNFSIDAFYAAVMRRLSRLADARIIMARYR